MIDGKANGRLSEDAADALVVLIAFSLPWSTSATGILVAVWACVQFSLLTLDKLQRECTAAHGSTPCLLFFCALLSVIWSDAAFLEAIDGLRPLIKLLAIPVLIVQFRSSQAGRRVVLSYFISCVILLLASFTSTVFPSLVPLLRFKDIGLPVKDYIAQSGEFMLCAFGLFYLAALDEKASVRNIIALIFASAFLYASIFQQVSRTGVFVALVLALLVGAKWLGWRKGLGLGVGLSFAIFSIAFYASDHFYQRMLEMGSDISQYSELDNVSSVGQRIEFWRKSWEIWKDAPLIGHGVGAVENQFRFRSSGMGGMSAAVTKNPHSEILFSAITMGLFGIILLLAMWVSHVRLFCVEKKLPWIGTVLVAQNAAGSLFNSHLHDFTQGWTYVFGVGVLGGMALRR